MKRDSVEATLSQILLWYDRPEILLLQTPNSTYTLAVRSGLDSSASNDYVGATLDIKMLYKYADNKIDLRYAISRASHRRFWKFTFNPTDRNITLYALSRNSEELQASLPESGFFCSEHDDIEIIENNLNQTKETLSIDGSWDFGEFSQLYGQVEDIYFLIADTKRYSDPNTTDDQRRSIRKVFERPWDGGGSYLGFYRKVANDNFRHVPLRVGGVSYNSPGHITIQADRQNFSDLLEIVDNFSDNRENTRKAYRKLNNFLSGSGLKRKGGTNSPVTLSTRQSIYEYSHSLAGELTGVDFDVLLEMSENNIVMAAKVLSSIHRRVERLFTFFEKGRVAHPAVTVR